MFTPLDFNAFPLFGSYDVVVCGGGPSGSIAAIASARLGVRTLVVEQYGFLGGALTAQSVSPMMSFHAGDKQVVQGIPDEVVERLVRYGASPGHIVDSIGYASSVTPFDAEGLKIVLEEMVTEAGGEVLFHTTLADVEVKGKEINRILVCTKSGLLCLAAKIFIDATGDGDLIAHAGVDYQKGRKEDGVSQPMTTNFRVGNVDILKVRQYILEHPQEFRIKDLESVKSAPRLSVSGFYELVRKAKDAGEFSIERKSILFFETNILGEVNVNTTRIFLKNATDARQFSEAEMEGRKQATEVFKFLKKWVPGFENAVYISSGFQIGVRESRHLKGCYILTEEDLVEDRPFEDTIAIGGYPVDIHPPTPTDAQLSLKVSKRERSIQQGWSYQIPYRCLINSQVVNLIVTGRCISATHQAAGAIRVTPIVMAIGQGAGTAAALAAMRGCSPHEIDIKELKETLKKNGAEVS